MGAVRSKHPPVTAFRAFPYQPQMKISHNAGKCTLKTLMILRDSEARLYSPPEAVNRREERSVTESGAQRLGFS